MQSSQDPRPDLTIMDSKRMDRQREQTGVVWFPVSFLTRIYVNESTNPNTGKPL